MRLVTVCTHRSGWFDALRVSARRGGYDLVVLGWGQKWTGLSMCFRLLVEFLDTVPADEVVAVIDGHDMIMLLPARVAMQRYRRLAPMGQVLVGGENPLGEPGARILKAVVFGTCRDGVTVNTGGYMGPAGAMRSLFALLKDRTGGRDAVNDQTIMNALCPELGADRLVIDPCGDIFFHATCVPMLPGHLLGRCSFGLDADLRNPITRRRPVALHAPGGLSLDAVCDLLHLPRGQPRNRWVWLGKNYWREALVLLLVLTAVAAGLWWLVRRRRGPSVRQR